MDWIGLMVLLDKVAEKRILYCCFKLAGLTGTRIKIMAPYCFYSAFTPKITVFRCAQIVVLLSTIGDLCLSVRGRERNIENGRRIVLQFFKLAILNGK